MSSESGEMGRRFAARRGRALHRNAALCRLFFHDVRMPSRTGVAGDSYMSLSARPMSMLNIRRRRFESPPHPPSFLSECEGSAGSLGA